MKPPKHHALQWRITALTLVILIISAIIAGGFAFQNSYDDSEDLFDEQLKSIAYTLADINPPPDSYPADDDEGIWVDIITDDQHPLAKTPLEFGLVSLDGHQFYAYHIHEHDKHIIVRQKSDSRDDLATLSALYSLVPLLVVSGVLMLVLPLVVWYSFRSVRVSVKALNLRDKHDLSPLMVQNFPKEILPFAHAINGLLDKAQADINAQKRFIADASHELRSPLTAISLQVQRLQSLSDMDKIQTGLAKLAISIDKNQQLVAKLLTLARLNAHVLTDTPTSVAEKVKEAVGFLLPIINDKAIVFDVDVSADFDTYIDPVPLLQLIKNLLQNAVIYTPPTKSVSVQLGKAIPAHATLVIGRGKHRTHTLTISDSGAGIDPTAYHQVFEPFARLSHSGSSDSSDSQGTGLGLTMVKAVCEQADVDLYFAKSDFGGLSVILVFG